MHFIVVQVIGEKKVKSQKSLFPITDLKTEGFLSIEWTVTPSSLFINNSTTLVH